MIALEIIFDLTTKKRTTFFSANGLDVSSLLLLLLLLFTRAYIIKILREPSKNLNISRTADGASYLKYDTGYYSCKVCKLAAFQK